MKLKAYMKELQYAFSATENWRSRCLLIGATVAFHFANFRRRRANAESDLIDVELRIGSRLRKIWMRPSSGDVFILYEVLAYESYRICEESLDPATVKTIVDCGANVGITALYLAERYPSARILCIEPDPANFAILHRNVSCESRIVPIKAALVGVDAGVVYLSQDRPAWGNSISDDPQAGKRLEVAGMTIPELCQRYSVERIDLLKVDIEGAEEQVFRSPGFLECVQFVVIELHNDYTLDRFAKDVCPMGFEIKPPGAHGGVRAVTAFPVN